MAEEAIEEQDSLNPVEETVQETQTEIADSGEDLAEKNKQLYERAKKAEAKAKDFENKLKIKESLKTNESSSPYATKEDVERIALTSKGYDTDEVNALMRYGGLKALEDDLIVKGIEAGRKLKKSTDATPSGTGRSTVYSKYTEQDLRRMSAEELEKIVPQ